MNTVYHGVPSPAKIERAREEAPSLTHGAEWLPDRMTDHDWPWILDNGAYTGHVDIKAWLEGLRTAESRMSTEPDFIVLPDRWQDWDATKRLHKRHAPHVARRGWPMAAVAHPGGSVGEIVDFAASLGADVLFIGGGEKHQRRRAGDLITAAHDQGLKAHIGQPGPSLSWARDVGADSIDTTSIVRNGYWNRLSKVEGTDQTEGVRLDEVIS